MQMKSHSWCCFNVLFSPLAQKYEEMNLDPNDTKVTGSCGVNSTELTLLSNTMSLTFTFTNVSPPLYVVTR